MASNIVSAAEAAVVIVVMMAVMIIQIVLIFWGVLLFLPKWYVKKKVMEPWVESLYKWPGKCFVFLVRLFFSDNFMEREQFDMFSSTIRSWPVTVNHSSYFCLITLDIQSRFLRLQIFRSCDYFLVVYQFVSYDPGLDLFYLWYLIKYIFH